MLAIQANEDGLPVVVELCDRSWKPVDAERWHEILAGSGDVLPSRVIVPVQLGEFRLTLPAKGSLPVEMKFPNHGG